MKHLLKKTKAATDRYHELSQQIKDFEKRMAEITELKKHIINYSRTKDVFTAYRQTGYSAKYYESNTESILLHQSAKQGFDSISSSKIPSIRDLQQEFNSCLGSKKVILKDYVNQKNLMKESLTVQSNVDHLFSQRSANINEQHR